MQVGARQLAQLRTPSETGSGHLAAVAPSHNISGTYRGGWARHGSAFAAQCVVCGRGAHAGKGLPPEGPSLGPRKTSARHLACAPAVQGAGLGGSPIQAWGRFSPRTSEQRCSGWGRCPACARACTTCRGRWFCGTASTRLRQMCCCGCRWAARMPAQEIACAGWMGAVQQPALTPKQCQTGPHGRAAAAGGVRGGCGETDGCA